MTSYRRMARKKFVLCPYTSRAASINYPTENQQTFNTYSVAWMGMLIQVGHILDV